MDGMPLHATFIDSEAEKKEPLFFSVHFFNTWQKLANFLTYIKERISNNRHIVGSKRVLAVHADDCQSAHLLQNLG